MTTIRAIRLNLLRDEWQNKVMNLNDTQIHRLWNSTREEATALKFWDRFCDLFRPEKKADVLAAAWDFIHMEDQYIDPNCIEKK